MKPCIMNLWLYFTHLPALNIWLVYVPKKILPKKRLVVVAIWSTQLCLVERASLYFLRPAAWCAHPTIGVLTCKRTVGNKHPGAWVLVGDPTHTAKGSFDFLKEYLNKDQKQRKSIIKDWTSIKKSGVDLKSCKTSGAYN